MTSIPSKPGAWQASRAWNSIQVEIFARALGLLAPGEVVAYVHWHGSHYILKDHHGTVLAALWQATNGDLVATRPDDAA
jgi:hypothetical protein